MKRYKILLFDLDDTLLDFKKAEDYAFYKLMEQHGLPQTDETFQRYTTFNKQVWADFEKHLLTVDEVKYKRFELFCQAYALSHDPVQMGNQYLEFLSQNYEFMDGARTLIDSIKDRYLLVLVTNGLSKVQNPRIINSGLKNTFSHFFISEELGVSKPSKEYFQHVFDRLEGAKKEDMLVIGDSLSSDMLGGINFGLDTCWYNPQQLPGYLPVTYQVSHLDDLKIILD